MGSKPYRAKLKTQYYPDSMRSMGETNDSKDMRHVNNFFLTVILSILAFSTTALAGSTIAEGEFIEKENRSAGTGRSSNQKGNDTSFSLRISKLGRGQT